MTRMSITLNIDRPDGTVAVVPLVTDMDEEFAAALAEDPAGASITLTWPPKGTGR